MRYLSTIIKRKYFDQILRGEKVYEYKAATPFWTKRIAKRPEAICFLCGLESAKFRINSIELIERDAALSSLIPTMWVYKIGIGERIKD